MTKDTVAELTGKVQKAERALQVFIDGSFSGAFSGGIGLDVWSARMDKLQEDVKRAQDALAKAKVEG